MEEILTYAKNLNIIDNNPYFVTLNKIPDTKKFLLSQECFISAVDNWSKALGLLLFYAPSYKERLVLVKNLYDEHGNGDLKLSHVNTFKSLLRSLNYQHEILIYNNTLPSYSIVDKFNNSINAAIMEKTWVYSIAMLAMIEYTYITVSKNIHNYLSNFLPRDEINHYSLHETIDETHAQELFDILEPIINIGSNMDVIKNGIKDGYDYFYILYESLNVYLQ
jgi:hypothetical protein